MWTGMKEKKKLMGKDIKSPVLGAFSLMIIFKIYTANMSLLHNVLYLYEVMRKMCDMFWYHEA